jgi:hypothetical protein
LKTMGFWSSGDWLLPMTTCQTHSEPIKKVLGNGFAWQGDRVRVHGSGSPRPRVMEMRRQLGQRLGHRRPEVFLPVFDAG